MIFNPLTDNYILHFFAEKKVKEQKAKEQDDLQLEKYSSS